MLAIGADGGGKRDIIEDILPLGAAWLSGSDVRVRLGKVGVEGDPSALVYLSINPETVCPHDVRDSATGLAGDDPLMVSH